MNWDDLKFVATVARHGSLLRAARELKVEHTTVGRRVDAAEHALGTKLFARSKTGVVLTREGERLLEPLQRVQDAVGALERRASAEHGELHGTVRVTSPETLGIAWLAPRLASFTREHPGLQIDLDPSGRVLDLGRREAEVALRFFRSKQKDLFVRRVAEVAHGLFAARSYLSRCPLRSARELKQHPLLADPPGSPEGAWLAKLSQGAKPVFASTLALALLGPAKAGLGIALLPRYLGDAEPDLVHLPMPDEPRDALWLTVHRDLRSTARVRAVLDFLTAQFDREKAALGGR